MSFSQKLVPGYEKKLSPSLIKKLQSNSDDDSIEIIIALQDKMFLKGEKIRVLKSYEGTNAMVIRITAKAFDKLLSNNLLLYADISKKPEEELTTGSLDINTNKINLAHNDYPFINGDSINASIKENKFDTTDLDYLGRAFNTGLASPVTTTHAAIMATTVAGAGNSSPYAYGVAQKARITSSNFAFLLPDADSVFRSHGISIQNHSYGTAIENYYGIEASAYDASAANNPNLLHVFSAGNNGGAAATSGYYAGLSGVSNFTGNFKIAKNVLTVGAIDSFYNVSPLSSKGPAHDGRVKPELVAFGEDGSSGAAAMVSGTASLIQQAYRKTHNDSFPSSALVKSILINSADDVGTKQVDFASGFGSLNAFNAIQTIQKNRILEDAVSHSNTKNFRIEIPEKTAQLKVTLAWTEPSSPPNTNKVLVNDLDMIIKHQGGEWQPWILNTKNNKDSLELIAVRGKDSLNNVEQITIENPVAGSYTVEVRGTNIDSTNQPFSIAYQIDTLNQFVWTFPTSTDQIHSGEANVLRWQTNIQGSATLEFSSNGNIWQQIANLPDVSIPFYKWNAPDTFSTALLRMKFSALPSVTSDTFIISRPTELEVGFNCADSFLLYWNKLPVNQYRLYQLEGNYLQPVKNTSDSFVLLKKNEHASIHYAVAPVVNGKPGLRSFTLNYPAKGVECYFQSFFLQFQNANDAGFTASLGSNFNISSISFQKLQKSSYVSLKTISGLVPTSLSFNDSNLTRGINTYRLQLQLKNGQIIYSNLVSLYHFQNSDVVVFPNPARQQEPVNIITNSAGRMTLYIYNASGMLLHQLKLKELAQQLLPFRLSKGIYFIKSINDEGKVANQKLVVY